MRWGTIGLAAVAVLGCIEPAPNAGGKHARFGGGPASAFITAEAKPRYHVGAIFGGAIELVGYDLVPEVTTRGKATHLVCYWRSIAQVDKRYQVFVHLDSPDGKRRTLADHWPAESTYPTEYWQPGQVVRDPVEFVVPEDHPGELLVAWVGLYAGEERLPITFSSKAREDGKNRLLLAEIPLR